MSTSPMPTMFEHGPSDRMQLLGAGELPAPGSCIICGSSDPERKFVFLGIHLDFLGALLLCDLCLTQSAEKIGCMAPSVAEMLHLQDQKLATSNAELQRVNEALNDRLSHYDAVLGHLDSALITDRAGINSSSDSDEPSPESSVNKAQSESTVSQPESDESGEVPGTESSSSSEPGDLTAGAGNSESGSNPSL